ncbi:MAG: hypothetical protein JXB32_04785 [Deltaproteobacteria bacterium]|nr:hypothetical protein [Deltaproteobacteria bacterium]
MRPWSLCITLSFLACAASQGPPGPCVGLECSGRGYCIADQDRGYCACMSGYHPVGTECEPNDPADPCLDIDCSGHGTCVVVDESPECACEPGFHHPGGYAVLCAPDALDGPPPDAGPCVPSGPERCNGRDDDCDGLADEDFDLDLDVLNCGHCGNLCSAGANAVPVCILAECDVRCAAGWSDLDADPATGCEAVCTPTGAPGETDCDGIDDDCDGLTDEDWLSPAACGFGPCLRESVCHRGEVLCRPRTPPAATDATCDGIDDDCDGVVDDEAAGCGADADADADADAADIVEAETSLCGNGIVDPGEECEGSASQGCGDCGTQHCNAGTCTWGTCDDPGFRCSTCSSGQCYNRLTHEDSGCGCSPGSCFANCGRAGEDYDVNCGSPGYDCTYHVESPGYRFDCHC